MPNVGLVRVHNNKALSSSGGDVLSGVGVQLVFLSSCLLTAFDFGLV